MGHFQPQIRSRLYFIPKSPKSLRLWPFTWMTFWGVREFRGKILLSEALFPPRMEWAKFVCLWRNWSCLKSPWRLWDWLTLWGFSCRFLRTGPRSSPLGQFRVFFSTWIKVWLICLRLSASDIVRFSILNTDMHLGVSAQSEEYAMIYLESYKAHDLVDWNYKLFRAARGSYIVHCQEMTANN